MKVLPGPWLSLLLASCALLPDTSAEQHKLAELGCSDVQTVFGYRFPVSQIQKALESKGRYSWLQAEHGRADLRLSEAGPMSYLDSGLHT